LKTTNRAFLLKLKKKLQYFLIWYKYFESNKRHKNLATEELKKDEQIKKTINKKRINK